jgi:hypothetical protein
MRKLTEEDLDMIVGTSVKGYVIARARIKSGKFSDSDHYGILLGKDEAGRCVTWQYHLTEDAPTVYWGHYFDKDEIAAIMDYNARDIRWTGDDSTGKDTSECTLKSFAVEITETLQMTVKCTAVNAIEAEDIVHSQYKDGLYVLGSEHLTGIGFSVSESENSKS